MQSLILKNKLNNCEHSKIYNKIDQEFNPSTPNMVWPRDFTYIKVNSGWFYLCVVMDLFSRNLIS